MPDFTPAELERRQKGFEQLTPDDKLKLLMPQLDLLTSSVSKKMATLPSLAALAATLVVVSTLDRTLVPLGGTEVRVILSFFLALIPISLHIYINDVQGGAKNAFKIIKSYHKENIYEEFEKNISLRMKLISNAPLIITYSFYLVIGFIIFKIWFC